MTYTLARLPTSRCCGKVVCATCSPHQAVLYKGKLERVCLPCFADIEVNGGPPQPGSDTYKQVSY